MSVLAPTGSPQKSRGFSMRQKCATSRSGKMLGRSDDIDQSLASFGHSASARFLYRSPKGGLQRGGCGVLLGNEAEHGAHEVGGVLLYSEAVRGHVLDLAVVGVCMDGDAVALAAPHPLMIRIRFRRFDIGPFQDHESQGARGEGRPGPRSVRLVRRPG